MESGEPDYSKPQYYESDVVNPQYKNSTWNLIKGEVIPRHMGTEEEEEKTNYIGASKEKPIKLGKYLGNVTITNDDRFNGKYFLFSEQLLVKKRVGVNNQKSSVFTLIVPAASGDPTESGGKSRKRKHKRKTKTKKNKKTKRRQRRY